MYNIIKILGIIFLDTFGIFHSKIFYWRPIIITETKNMDNILIYENDLPNNLDLGDQIAIDTETTGLDLNRDRICLVQISAGDNMCHIVKMNSKSEKNEKPLCSNLMQILSNQSIKKIFHYGRFDLAMLSIWATPVQGDIYCTKIASKLARTYTDKHGLKDLCLDLLGIELCKESQSSDWASENLSSEQIRYAANDVLYLHQLRNLLDSILIRESRNELAQACFQALTTRVELDLKGWYNDDIFAH